MAFVHSAGTDARAVYGPPIFTGMDRSWFHLSQAALPMAARAMPLNAHKTITDHFKPSEGEPVLYLGMERRWKERPSDPETIIRI